MSVAADRAGNGFVELTVDGKRRLGVKISGHKRSMAGQFQSLRRGHGWIVVGDRIDTWEIEGLIEHEGAIYAYGPFRDNRSFLDVTFSGTDRHVDHLLQLVTALETLEERSIDPGRYQPMLMLSFDGGGMLFLPRDVLDGVLSAQTEQERVEGYDRFNHPDLDGERNAAFFVAVLAYRVLTDSFPYAAESVEEIHQRIRQHKVLPPHLMRPEIRTDLSDLVVRSLDAGQNATLEEWEQILVACRNEGTEREVADEERTRLREAAGRFAKSAESDYRRRDYFRRNWRTMAIVAAIVVVVGAVGGSILKNALKPRITVGMSPKQVVELFYTSMNTFNSQAMQDCVIDGAGKAAISEATNLYVISRVREGYQGTSGYVSAQKWIDLGKPKLASGLSVYGVADMAVKQDAPGRYTVSYQKWEPVVPPDNQQPSASNAPVLMKVQEWQQRDLVYLKNEGKFWAIYRIDHLVRDRIGPPITVTNPALRPDNPFGGTAGASSGE